jgi:hypothetical protein
MTVELVHSGFDCGRRFGIFSNVTVEAFSQFLNQPAPGTRDTGGPIFGSYSTEFPWLRHNAYGQVFDIEPIQQDANPRKIAGRFLYGGPICHSFTHYAAEFASRLATNAGFNLDGVLFLSTPQALDRDLFIPKFVEEALEYFGLNGLPILLVSDYCQVEELVVYEQGDQLGVETSSAYLTYLDSFENSQPSSRSTNSKIFFSRDRLDRGKLAGEGYIADCLADIGYNTIHPEDLGWIEVLKLASITDEIVLTEGGVAHALSLLGRGSRKVSIISRRPSGSRGRRDCYLPLASRSKEFVKELDAIVLLLDPAFQEHIDCPNALTLMNPEDLFRQLQIELNIPEAIKWDKSLFISCAIEDFYNYQNSFYIKHAAKDLISEDSFQKMKEDFARWIVSI